MITPCEYAERYRRLTIHSSGSSRDNVRVEIYRIGSPDDEQGKLWQALKDHFRGEKKKDANYSLTLTVGGSQQQFRTHEDLLRHVVNPFWGKGSPEDCQIALSVAVLLNRTTLSQVQAYANSHIGLDCNGFVGNYLWREVLHNQWSQHPGKEETPAPSANIASILEWAEKKSKEKGIEIKEVDDIDPERMYILAMVDKQLKVVPGGPKSKSGHIVITQPKRFMAQSFTWDSMGFYDLKLAKKDAYGHPALWAVESTGPEMLVGLRESWYAFRPVHNKKKEVIPSIFDVYRGSKAQNLKFRAAPVP